MTAQHKAALAEGRNEGRAVKNYLEALQQNRPRRGRRRTPESITKRLAAIDAAYAERSGAPTAPTGAGAHGPAEGARGDGHQGRPRPPSRATFVKTAAKYAERKGISYAAWRELGVPADVLKKAGISRAS